MWSMYQTFFVDGKTVWERNFDTYILSDGMRRVFFKTVLRTKAQRIKRHIVDQTTSYMSLSDAIIVTAQSSKPLRANLGGLKHSRTLVFSSNITSRQNETCEYKAQKLFVAVNFLLLILFFRADFDIFRPSANQREKCQNVSRQKFQMSNVNPFRELKERVFASHMCFIPF